MSATVLLVDDNKNFLRVMTYLVKEMGLDARPVESAAEGLAVLSAVPVALVISDVRLPGMDGLKFLKEVRKRDGRIPLIVLTALESLELGRQVQEIGATLLTKATSREDLRKTILNCLQRDGNETGGVGFHAGGVG